MTTALAFVAGCIVGSIFGSLLIWLELDRRGWRIVLEDKT